MHVRPGTYTPATSLTLRDNTTWFFEPGTFVASSFTLFDTTGLSNFSVTGQGVFSSSSVTSALILAADHSVVEFRSITASLGACITITAGEVSVTGRSLLSSGSVSTVSVNGGDSYITVERIRNDNLQQTTARGLEISNTSPDTPLPLRVDIRVVEISAVAGEAVYQNLARSPFECAPHITASVIKSLGASAVRSLAGITFINAGLIQNSTSAFPVIDVASGQADAPILFVTALTICKDHDNGATIPGPMLRAVGEASLLSLKVNQLGTGMINTIEATLGCRVDVAYNFISGCRAVCSLGAFIELKGNEISVGHTGTATFECDAGSINCDASRITCDYLTSVSSGGIINIRAAAVRVAKTSQVRTGSIFLDVALLEVYSTDAAAIDNDVIDGILHLDVREYLNSSVSPVSNSITGTGRIEAVISSLSVPQCQTFLSVSGSGQINYTVQRGIITAESVLTASTTGNCEMFVEAMFLSQLPSARNLFGVTSGRAVISLGILDIIALSQAAFAVDDTGTLSVTARTVSITAQQPVAFISLRGLGIVRANVDSITSTAGPSVDAGSAPFEFPESVLTFGLIDSTPASPSSSMVLNGGVQTIRWNRFTRSSQAAPNGVISAGMSSANISGQSLISLSTARVILVASPVYGTMVFDVAQIVSSGTIIDLTAGTYDLTFNSLTAKNVGGNSRLANIAGGHNVTLSGLSRVTDNTPSIVVTAAPDNLSLCNMTLANSNAITPALSIASTVPVVVKNYGMLLTRSPKSPLVDILIPAVFFVNTAVN